MAALILIPFSFLILGMFWTTQPGFPGEFTLDHVTTAFTDASTFPYLANSLIFATGSTILSITLATFFAWVAHRTDTPGRKLLDALPLLLFMIPSLLFDIGWTFLLSPKIGLINLFLMQLLGLPAPPFNIYTIWGMIWAQTVTSTPVAYLLISGAFVNMDPTLEESAQVSGAGRLRILRTVTLPLLYPSLIATGALNFMIALSSFETPVIIGLPGNVHVYMSTIFEEIQLRTPPNHGLATALAFVNVLLSAAIVAFYVRSTRKLAKYVVVTGKGYRPGVTRLGWARYLALGIALAYVFVGIVLPIITMLLVSLVPFYTVTAGNPFSDLSLKNYSEAIGNPLVGSATVNSLLLAFGSAAISTLMAALFSYAAIKTNLRGKRMFEIVGVIPLLFPGVIFSLALLWTSITVYRPLYSTIWILVIAYIVVLLPRAMRAITNSIIQLHSELEEAAFISGAGWRKMFQTINLPLLKPALLNSFTLAFIQAYQILGPAILLITPGTLILPALVLRFWIGGQLVQLAAASMIFGGIAVAIVLAAKYIFRMKV